MTYKFDKVVKVTIKFEDSQKHIYESFKQWLHENEIFPAVRGGFGGINYASWNYSEENAEKIRAWMQENDCTYSHFLKS